MVWIEKKKVGSDGLIGQHPYKAADPDPIFFSMTKNMVFMTPKKLIRPQFCGTNAGLISGFHCLVD